MSFGTTVEKENTAKRQKEGRQQLLTPSKKVECYCLELRDEGFKPLVGSKSFPHW